jgi:TPP-dependent pyruvate/acetoin dehydrogenase alpha subunit
VLTDAVRDAMRTEIVDEVTAAMAFAESSPNPVEADLYRDVYSS